MRANVQMENRGGAFAGNNGGRIIGLDAMRISLAILIFMFHSGGHFGCDYSFLNDFVSVGAIAMTGFFVLSGYAMRMVYGERDIHEKNNLLKFYIRRIVSIIPLYYVVSLIYIIFLGEESLTDNLLLFPIEALGLQSTFSSLFGVSHNDGTWFISCILLAYLIYPLIQTIVKQIHVSSKIVILFVLVIIETWAVVVSHRFGTARLYDNPFYRILEFGCGIIIADLNIKYDYRWLHLLRNRWTLIITVIILFFGVSAMRHYCTFGDFMLYNVLVLPCCCIMLFSLGINSNSSLKENAVLQYFGKISYAFFLVQYFAWPIGKIAIRAFGYDSNLFRIFLTFSFCVLVSILLYEIVQRPIEKLSKRIIQFNQI